jgi:hypothetical protein
VTGATLRGHYDGVFVAERFVQVRGWICTLDRRAAEPPLTLTLHGRRFPGYGLNRRRDLAEAGIGEGFAFFDAVLPIEDAAMEASYALGITDALGDSCTLQPAASRVRRFAPLGAIDEAGARGISGWVFDPHHGGGAAHPSLFFDGEFVCRVHPTIDRHDLSYDLGDGMKSFGYEVSGEVLVPHLTRFCRREPRRSGGLILASSGVSLAAVTVGLEGGSPVMVSRADVRESARVWVSDRLALLLAESG